MSTATLPSARSRRRGIRGAGGGWAPYVFLTPFVVLFLVFLVAPIITALYTSLFTVERSGLGFGNENASIFVGLENYRRALSNQGFVASFGRVLLFGVVQVPIMLALATGLALLFDSAVVRWKRFFQLAVFIPYAVPTVVAALLWGFLYQPRVSPLVSGLEAIGLDIAFLAPGTVLWSIANVTTWSVTGVNMIIIFAALQTVPRDIYEAARIDGARELRVALQIKLPMVLPAIFLTLLFSIIGTLQLFNEPMTLRSITSNVTGDFTPNMAVFSTTTLGGNLNLGSAMAILLGLVTFALSILVSVLSNRRKGGS
ncbi:carbohydrate ABC transporter permease [Bogoriella caseilytica]|uniref:Carbohydrate ABC transporter membrane protein 1 (CUT1 family) n=1 Tax=Bogoriella caseilytica TaxID=56055 RepID=A0A3N2BC85_9MICO|nr:sugar ABC transporter permease [Bogoriella caseilytica]ROR72877.1 carbohydrate ABC transporter membrane protein 1 (CUT1 family) [Bogoriella caseilytica]